MKNYVSKKINPVTKKPTKTTLTIDDDTTNELNDCTEPQEEQMK